MDKLYNEKKVEELSEKVITSVKEKIQEDVSNSIYQELSNYLYDHYENAKNRVEKELIEQITEEFVKDKKAYKYKKLRDKIFIENRGELTRQLTEEKIFESIEKMVCGYTHKEHAFKWRWEEGIAKIIIKNIDKFKENERIQKMFAIELERKQSRINWLEEKLRNVEDSLND